MSLKHILLGVLSESQSGYDIKKYFERSLKNFWNAELSQIYPLLQKMEKEGLLDSTTDDSDIGPKKRIYGRTEKGNTELESWLSKGPVVGTERIAYLAQVFFLANLKDKASAIAYMQKLKDYTAARLATLKAAETEWAGQDARYPDALPDDEFYPQLTLTLGIARLRGTLEWCEECISRIQSRKEEPVSR